MINYPTNQKKSVKSTNLNNNTGKRGMSLETVINSTNKYYLYHNIANIHKKPTPIQVVKVSYPKRSAAKITEAYYKTPSTTDYNGIYRGHYVDFEAKETDNVKKFTFSNIHQHQLKHLKSVIEHGGIAFFILYFKKHDVYIGIEAIHIINAIKDGHKTIDYDIICKIGYILDCGYNPQLDYLKFVDLIISKEVKDFNEEKKIY